jgi:hypothetical protein
MSRVSSWIDLYITQKDQIFIADEVIINSTQEMMSLNVINWLAGVAVEFNAIAKIRKYIGFHEKHHFIPMTMEVYDAPSHDMDRFIKECARFFNIKRLKDHLPLFFCIQFFR